jgi:hypothetical protein
MRKEKRGEREERGEETRSRGNRGEREEEARGWNGRDRDREPYPRSTIRGNLDVIVSNIVVQNDRKFGVVFVF